MEKWAFCPLGILPPSIGRFPVRINSRKTRRGEKACLNWQSTEARNRLRGCTSPLAESSKPWPDYESMYLPVAERFCAEEQITIPHQILLAGKQGMQMILEAIAKIKANTAELAE